MWKDMATANKPISSHFPKDPHKYGQMREQGVGQTTILKFLGKGWKQWKIQHALETLYGKKELVEAFFVRWIIRYKNSQHPHGY